MAHGEWAPDPKAQKLFEQIDVDKSGVLAAEEVIAYLVSEVGSDKALKLVRVLDTNGDGMITADEWHKAEERATSTQRHASYTHASHSKFPS